MAKNLTIFERQKRFLPLPEYSDIRVAEIARLVDVLEGTVRNDLKAIAAERQLIRVLGGATIKEDSL